MLSVLVPPVPATRRSVFAVRGDGWFFHAPANPALLGAVAASACIGLAALTIPPLMDVFDTVGMDRGSLAVALALSLLPFAATELFKAAQRRGRPGPRKGLFRSAR